MAPRAQQGRIAAVIFNLDGVLLDSESAWVRVKREYTEETGGHWQERAQWEMLGMSSTEWSTYMHDQLGVPGPPERISAEVADRLVELAVVESVSYETVRQALKQTSSSRG